MQDLGIALLRADYIYINPVGAEVTDECKNTQSGMPSDVELYSGFLHHGANMADSAGNAKRLGDIFFMVISIERKIGSE